MILEDIPVEYSVRVSVGVSRLIPRGINAKSPGIVPEKLSEGIPGINAITPGIVPGELSEGIPGRNTS